MPLRIEKSLTGDVSALIGLALLPCFQGLRLMGVIIFDSPDWPFYLGSVVCAVCSIPILARLVSSAPLVEMDEESVSFFVGWARNERCRMPRSALLMVSVETLQQDPVLCLLLDVRAVQVLRQFRWTPCLEIKPQEVVIDAGHVRGDLEKIAESWGEAIRPPSVSRSHAGAS